MTKSRNPMRVQSSIVSTGWNAELYDEPRRVGGTIILDRKKWHSGHFSLDLFHWLHQSRGINWSNDIKRDFEQSRCLYSQHPDSTCKKQMRFLGCNTEQKAWTKNASSCTVLSWDGWVLWQYMTISTTYQQQKLTSWAQIPTMKLCWSHPSGTHWLQPDHNSSAELGLPHGHFVGFHFNKEPQITTWMYPQNFGTIKEQRHCIDPFEVWLPARKKNKQKVCLLRIDIRDPRYKLEGRTLWQLAWESRWPSHHGKTPMKPRSHRTHYWGTGNMNHQPKQNGAMSTEAVRMPHEQLDAKNWCLKLVTL